MAQQKPPRNFPRRHRLLCPYELIHNDLPMKVFLLYMLCHFAVQDVCFQGYVLPVPLEHPYVQCRRLKPLIRIPLTVVLRIVLVKLFIKFFFRKYFAHFIRIHTVLSKSRYNI